MRDLSVIIPARNEIFLAKTVENVLANIRADTEVIAVCDGYWPEASNAAYLLSQERVTVLHYEKSIGQRAATNRAADASDAKYIMKLDAHCSVDEGFDAKLIADCQPDWTMVPSQYNLHAFDWKCVECGEQDYQSAHGWVDSVPQPPQACKQCAGNRFRMVMIWTPRRKRKTVSWRFDSDLHFQYWGSHKKRPEVRAQGDLIETMSFLGACMFLERERFWKLGGMDEGHGSWGQFGTEWACKSWLSGGKLITSLKTWYAHLFRTGNFGRDGNSTWPYPMTGSQQERARKYSKDLWLNDRWPQAVHPLSWLIERFAPVPDWEHIACQS